MMDALIKNRSKMIQIALSYSPGMRKEMSLDEFIKNSKSQSPVPDNELIVFLDQKDEKIIRSECFWKDYERYVKSFSNEVELIVFTTLKTMEMELSDKKLIVKKGDKIESIKRMFILPKDTFMDLRGYDDNSNPVVIVKHGKNDYTDIGDICMENATQTTINKISNLSSVSQKQMLSKFMYKGRKRFMIEQFEDFQAENWMDRTYKDLTENYNRHLSAEGLMRLPKYSLKKNGILKKLVKAQEQIQPKQDILKILEVIYNSKIDELFELYNETQEEKYKITSQDINDICEDGNERPNIVYFYQLIDQLDEYLKEDIFRYSQIISMFLEIIASLAELDKIDEEIEKHKDQPGYYLYSYLSIKLEELYSILEYLELGEYFSGLYTSKFKSTIDDTKKVTIIQLVDEIQNRCIKNPRGVKDFTLDEDIYHLMVEPFSAINTAVKEDKFLEKLQSINL